MSDLVETYTVSYVEKAARNLDDLPRSVKRRLITSEAEGVHTT
jgi:hypothetical protein